VEVNGTKEKYTQRFVYSEGMKRYILSHIPMALVYGLLLSFLGGGWWPISLIWVGEQAWWIAGLIIGVLLVYLDRVAYIYSFPNEQLSQQANWYIEHKDYLKALILLDTRRHEQIKLTFRSSLFMIAWIPLAFFALTSTASIVGKGVVMGLMLHILLDSWRMQKEAPDKLNQRLFWQVKRVITLEEQLIFMWIMTGIFVFFSWWVR